MQLEWGTLQSQQIEIVFEHHALRIQPRKGGVLGKLTDEEDNVYLLDEVVLRTPSEHTIQGKRFPLEVQMVHSAI